MTRREPVWISIEGVNGVGKTHLAHALAARLQPGALLLSELTDTGGDRAREAVVSALSAGRSFLRTGHPLTETMALLALKVREYEHVLALSDPPQVVIEDRGVDTVAVYQAAVITAPDNHHPDPDPDPGSGRGPAADGRLMAQQIYDTAAQWRPLPDRTLLLLDDLRTCELRYAAREGRSLTGDERDLIAHAAGLYRWRAGMEPERFRTVHRGGRDELELLAELEQLVVDAVGASR